MSAKRPNDGQEPNDIRAKSLSRAIPSEAGGTRGIREAAPKTNGRQKSNNIRARTSPAPFHPERTENRRLRQRPQTEGKGGKEGGGKVGKLESRKAGRPGKAGKPESRKAGKPKSREAEKQKAEKQESRAEAEKA